MISSPGVFDAFSDELVKLSTAPGTALALGKLGKRHIAGLLGLGALGGVVAEQAKDDVFAGRRMRKQQAQARGVSPLTM